MSMFKVLDEEEQWRCKVCGHMNRCFPNFCSFCISDKSSEKVDLSLLENIDVLGSLEDDEADENDGDEDGERPKKKSKFNALKPSFSKGHRADWVPPTKNKNGAGVLIEREMLNQGDEVVVLRKMGGKNSTKPPEKIVCQIADTPEQQRAAGWVAVQFKKVAKSGKEKVVTFCTRVTDILDTPTWNERYKADKSILPVKRGRKRKSSPAKAKEEPKDKTQAKEEPKDKTQAKEEPKDKVEAIEEPKDNALEIPAMLEEEIV
jgi:hypothetical protein|eukprot:Stramenopile-MAST_4_protein_2579